MTDKSSTFAEVYRDVQCYSTISKNNNKHFTIFKYRNLETVYLTRSCVEPLFFLSSV
jgi:hypothetical protein